MTKRLVENIEKEPDIHLVLSYELTLTRSVRKIFRIFFDF
jgi:hypothetical protein